jgi:hypothetical protein
VLTASQIDGLSVFALQHQTDSPPSWPRRSKPRSRNC